jgi:hypothetical protein
MTFIEENAEAIVKSDAFLALKKDAVAALVKGDGLDVEEYALFEAVIAWGKAELKRQKIDDDSKALKKVLEDILPLVRLPCLSITQIVSNLASSGLVDSEMILKLCSYAGTTKEEDRKKISLPFKTTPREPKTMVKESKLLDRKYHKELKKMFDNKKVKLTLLWRGSRDGFDCSTFHRLCDNKGATLMVAKSNSYNHIFGGYNPQSWTQSSSYSYGSGAWLYVLDNPSHTPIKVMQTSGSAAVYNYSSYGPTWGSGHDMYFPSNCNSSSISCSTSSYSQIATGYTGYYSSSTMGGSSSFTVSEVEIFSVEEKK